MEPHLIFENVPKILDDHHEEGTDSFIFKRKDYVKFNIYNRGVYLFYTKEGDLLYVGKSGAYLRDRIRQHVNLKTNTAAFMDYAYYIGLVIPDWEHGRMIEGKVERILIESLNPIFNTESKDDPKYGSCLMSDTLISNPSIRLELIKRLILRNRTEIGRLDTKLSTYGDLITDVDEAFNMLIESNLNVADSEVV